MELRNSIEKFEWIPLKQVGFFKFGDDIKIHSNILVQIPEERDNKVEWDVYTIPGRNIRIFTERNKIVSIACYDNFYFKNVNIIGYDAKKINTLLNTQSNIEVDEIEIDGQIQKVYEYDALGLQVWTKNELVVSIFANAECDDSF